MKRIFAPRQHYLEMRDAFFEELFQIASSDKNVIVLMADQWVQVMKKFEEKIPQQLVNAGIAEQNMISVAAGLALSGKKVFVHAIASFAVLRCYEQIKVDLSIMDLPVTIAGIGGGLTTYGSDGPTHQAIQDVAVMRTIPGIRILNASDTVSLSAFPHLAYQVPKLTYIQFGKGNLPILYSKNHNFLNGMDEVAKGTDAVILSTGIMTHQAVNIASYFDGKVGVIDIYQPKPLNEKKLSKLLSSYKKIIVLEEHLAYGGLATIVADFLADYAINRDFLRIGLPDENCFVYGDRNYIHEQIGISSPQIIKRIGKFLNHD